MLHLLKEAAPHLCGSSLCPQSLEVYCEKFAVRDLPCTTMLDSLRAAQCRLLKPKLGSI